VCGDILIAGPCVSGFSDLLWETSALRYNLRFLVKQFLRHFVQIHAVDLGEMGGGPVLQRVDGRGVESVLDVAEGGAPE
jgi:hypothetical protein